MIKLTQQCKIMPYVGRIRTMTGEWYALEESGAQIQAVSCQEQSEEQTSSAKYGNGFQNFDFDLSS
jgi:hypothetical protein